MKKIFIGISCLTALMISLGLSVLKDDKKRKNAQIKQLIEDAEKNDQAVKVLLKNAKKEIINE